MEAMARRIVNMRDMQQEANGIVCPKCGHDRFWTTNNWASLPGTNFRRRECRNCHHVVRTEEKLSGDATGSNDLL